MLYGLGAAGEAGARRAIAIFEAEIRRTMGNLGVRDIASISRDHVLLPGEAPPRPSEPPAKRKPRASSSRSKKKPSRSAAAASN
jgi:hypothetical protein